MQNISGRWLRNVSPHHMDAAARGVRQHWEQSANGKAWDTIFDGRYEPVKGH